MTPMVKSITNQEKLVKIHQRAYKSLVDYFWVFQADKNDYKEPADFHYTVSDILLKDNRHFAIEMFRESAKTSYVLKAFPLYKLTYPDPGCRYIVIIKNNQELASAKLAEIANEYTNNEVLNQNLIEVHKNSAKVFEATVRGVDKKNHTVRIEAYGKGSSIRGLAWGTLRPQIVIGDDLQDLEDSESETVQEKDWNWFLSDVNFLAKTGRIFLIGNNLGAKCIIERVFDTDVLDFVKLKVAALDENNKPTWPEAFSKEFLLNEKQQYVSLGKLDIWYRERMCIALADELKVFHKDDFKYIDEEVLKTKTLDYYILGDPASSKNRTADDAVLCVIGKERHLPDWYIVEFIGGNATKLDPVKYIDALFTLYQKYRPLRVGIESVGYQQALFYFITEEQKKREVYFTVHPIKTRKNKEEKIKGVLSPMFKAGVIHHLPTMFKFEEQLLSFPKGLHDDYPDVVAMGADIISSTSYEDEEATQGHPDMTTFAGMTIEKPKKDVYVFNNY